MTPSEVIAYNKKQGYNLIAITDHQTVAGVQEAIDAGKNKE